MKLSIIVLIYIYEYMKYKAFLENSSKDFNENPTDWGYLSLESICQDFILAEIHSRTNNQF